MRNPTRLDEIRRATAAAVEKYHARRAAAVRPGPARPGDLYLFPGPAAHDLSWVVVSGPAEDGLLFLVPADGHPLAGLTDVVVAESVPGGPLVLRCGFGLWVHPDELGPDRRVGILEERYVQRAGRKLAQVATGQLEGTAAQKEAEANPDYEEWLAEVERAVDTLASALRIKEEEVFTDGFSRRPRQADTAAERPEAEPVLAASGRALARLYEALGSPEQGPPARQVDFLYPGELFLVLESGGVAVVYLREGEQPPPELHEIDAAGAEHPARWLFTPGGTAARAVFGWRDGRVRLRFGRGEQAREVTVRQ